MNEQRLRLLAVVSPRSNSSSTAFRDGEYWAKLRGAFTDQSADASVEGAAIALDAITLIKADNTSGHTLLRILISPKSIAAAAGTPYSEGPHVSILSDTSEAHLLI